MTWVIGACCVSLLFDSAKILLMQAVKGYVSDEYMWMVGPSDARVEHVTPFFRLIDIMGVV